MLHGVASALLGSCSLADLPLGLGTRHGSSLGHRGGGNAGGAEEDGGGAGVEAGGGGVGLELEEGEIGVRARRTKVRRRRVVGGGGEAVGVGERGAFGARGVVVNWGVGRGEMVKAERAEGRRVEAEDAGGAEEAVDASEPDVVEMELGPLVVVGVAVGPA